MNKILKRTLVCSLLTCSIGLSGCASIWLADDFNPTSRITHTKTLAQDTMIAIGQSVNDGQNSGLVFAGQKYTYLINEGGESFHTLLKVVPAEKLILQSPSPLQLEFTDKSNFKGNVRFRYIDPVSQISKEKLAELQALGFEIKDYPIEKHLYRSFDYKGQLFESTTPNKLQHQFSKPYPIILTQEIDKTKANVGNIGKTIILTPVALTFDIITSPVWGTLFLIYKYGNM